MKLSSKNRGKMKAYELIMRQLRTTATFYQTKKYGWVSEKRFKELLKKDSENENKQTKTN